MHKSVFGLIILLIASLNIKAQVYKYYVDSNADIVSDKTNAVSYILLQRMDSDSVWMTKRYNLQDSIISTGTYKDMRLSIPHGKFIYYTIYKPQLVIKYDTLKQKEDTTKVFGKDAISSTGYFVNGIRSGKWVDYNRDGKINHVKTYENGKLNGLYQAFNPANGTLLFQGNYVNDLKEGMWNLFAPNGDTIQTDTYKGNKKIKQTFIAKNTKFDLKFIYPESQSNFRRELFDKIPFKLVKHLNRGATYAFTLTKNGRFTDPYILNGISLNIDSIIIRAVLNSKSWKPAFNGTEAIESSVTISITFSTIVDNMLFITTSMDKILNDYFNAPITSK